MALNKEKNHLTINILCFVKQITRKNIASLLVSFQFWEGNRKIEQQNSTRGFQDLVKEIQIIAWIFKHCKIHLESVSVQKHLNWFKTSILILETMQEFNLKIDKASFADAINYGNCLHVMLCNYLCWFSKHASNGREYFQFAIMSSNYKV